MPNPVEGLLEVYEDMVEVPFYLEPRALKFSLLSLEYVR